MSKSKNIAVFAFPFASHPVPLLSLTRKIAESDPNLKFFFFNTQESNEPLFKTNDEKERIRPVSVGSGLPEGFVFKGDTNVPVGYFLNSMKENFEKAVEETQVKFDCLLTDAFMWFSKDMAERMNALWIPYITGGPRATLVYVETDLIRARLGTNPSEDATLEFLPGYSSIRAKDLMRGIVSEAGFPSFVEMSYKMGKTLPHATAVVINSFEELDPIVVQTLKSKLKAFLNIGPFILKSPPPPTSDVYNCLDFLNNHPKASVVYISTGTLITPQPDELRAIAEALEETNFPFIWSLKTNFQHLLPKGSMERLTKGEKGLIVPWAPQMKILEHGSVGAFVTHCGWKSVTESVIGGVPMIGRPFIADQKLNMRVVEAVWGFGVGVEGGVFSKDGTVKALNVVLGEEGKLMREKIGVYKELAFKAVGSDGSSTRNFNLLLDIVTGGQ